MENKKTKTLFILGAGASYPYGFPLATGLRQFIIQNLDSLINSYFRDVSDWGISLKNDMLHESKSFRRIFNLSDTQSIDLFLTRNNKFVNIGKSAILFSILKMEKESKFRERCENSNHNWYTYLFRRMTKSIINDKDYQNILENNFSFITFNYDRSLEKYFLDSYINSFSQIPKQELINVFMKIPIIHVYGDLGEIDKIPYGADVSYNLNHEFYIDTISKIKTPYEYKENESIKKEIITADRIFILGFSYADENMLVLNLKNTVKNGCRIFCCCFGMNEIDIDALKNTHFMGLNSKFGKSNNDSLSFLQEYLDFKEPEVKIAFIDEN